jgi:hypothetical protein
MEEQQTQPRLHVACPALLRCWSVLQCPRSALQCPLQGVSSCLQRSCSHPYSLRSYLHRSVGNLIECISYLHRVHSDAYISIPFLYGSDSFLQGSSSYLHIPHSYLYRLGSYRYGVQACLTDVHASLTGIHLARVGSSRPQPYASRSREPAAPRIGSFRRSEVTLALYPGFLRKAESKRPARISLTEPCSGTGASCSRSVHRRR